METTPLSETKPQVVLERVWPKVKDKIKYPTRVTVERFDKYENEMRRRVQATPRYNKVKSGFDYETNKQILVGGTQYIRLIRKLQCKFCQRNKRYDIDCKCDWKDVESVLQYQTKEEYMEETEQLYKDVRLQNQEIDAYNAKVYDLFFQLAALRRWDSFVEFEGVKYGQKHFHMLHNTEGCQGRLHAVHLPCACSQCSKKKFCGSRGTEFYVCTKCGQKSEEEETLRTVDK